MRKGIYAGVWDFLHPGHLSALDWAKKQCDWLVAAVNVDPTVDNPQKSEPWESEIDRYMRLIACRYVDCVVYYRGESELEELYRIGDYDFAFISVEHKESYTQTHGAKPIFVPRFSHHSSSKLRQILEAH